MFKKIFAASAVAAVLVFSGASAAMAATTPTPTPYPPTVGCTANPATIAVGQTSVITCTGLQPNVSGTLTVSGPGVQSDTLSSFVHASANGTSSVRKTTSAT